MNDHNGDEPGVAVFEVLARSHGFDILNGIEAETLSAREICENEEIPPSTFYRRIDDLQANGLVDVTMRVDDDGDHFHVYTSKVDSITLSCDGVEEGYEIRIDERDVSAEEEPERSEMTRVIEQ